MGHYEYYFINLNGDLYLGSVMEKLGGFFDICISCLGWQGEDTIRLFVDSGLANEFERQTTKYVSEMTSLELVSYAAKKLDFKQKISPDVTIKFAKPYFIGQMIGYFQMKCGMRYGRIFDAISYKRLLELSTLYANLAPAEFAEILKRELADAPFKSHLKQHRKLCGLTQAELASRACVSVRAIQQYEQGVKDIRKASVDTVLRLSRVLQCSIEDLI